MRIRYLAYVFDDVAHVYSSELLWAFSIGKSRCRLDTISAHGAAVCPVMCSDDFSLFYLHAKFHGIAAITGDFCHAIGIIHMRSKHVAQAVPSENKKQENAKEGGD